MRLLLLTALTMCLFAANSLLCRLAFTRTGIDPQSFTILRLVSGAAVLWLLTTRRRRKRHGIGGSFTAAAGLFGYMATFSLAYQEIGAAAGTLILAAALLVTAILAAGLLGEHLNRRQLAGAAISLGGLAVLFAPALSRPPLVSALLMACAGASWVVYSLAGRESTDSALDTAGNFVRCLPVVIVLLPFVKSVPFEGALYAIASGALASGFGYILWYRLVAVLSTIAAALIQLSVPVLTTLGAWLLLGEAVSVRFFVSGCVILFGIALAQTASTKPAPSD